MAFRRPASRRTRARALLAGAAGAAALVLFGAAAPWAPGAGAATRHASGSEKLLLALGDSLAAGYQPTDGHRPPPTDPATGLPDAGYPGGYAADLAEAEHLRLLDLACPGETTRSFTTHPAQGACTKAYRQIAGARNQLTAAIAELDAHRGQVALVTFDLGGNDVDVCYAHGSLDTGCLATRAVALAHRLPHILATLQAALRRDDPGATFAAMTYYDPFLALAYEPGGFRGDALATISLGGLAAVNASLTRIYHHDGILVAPVAAAFASGKILPLQRYGGRLLPRDVATLCRYTYMCPVPGAATGSPGQNVHPNATGYAAIARAFEKVLHRAAA